MTPNPLAALPDRLEQLGSALSERLMARFPGERAPAALLGAGVLTPRARAFFDDRTLPFEPLLDRFTALALFSDCLTVVTLACLNARPAVDWGRLDGARLLLTRVGTFYAAVYPRYAAFRNLPRERLTDFLNAYAAGEELFSLRCEDTRMMGVRLCRFLAGQGQGDLAAPYVNGALGLLWQYVHPRVGLPPEAAEAIWAALRAA